MTTEALKEKAHVGNPLLAILGAALCCGCATAPRADVPEQGAYVIEADNSLAIRRAERPLFKDAAIEAWKLRLESDVDLSRPHETSGDARCSLSLESADIPPLANLPDQAIRLDATLRKMDKPDKIADTEEDDRFAITQFGWDSDSIELPDGWTLKMRIRQEDYPAAEGLQVMFGLGAYFRQNYGCSVLAKNGLSATVTSFRADKQVFIEVVRYTVRGKAVDEMHQSWFRTFCHGFIRQSRTVSSKDKEG